ncbi:hypothetical protein [Wenjunlia tyrosinilytica]|uniref:Acyl carrier protein n=1 Tax=Wenjunlia tyrosinilytica TaxID=1544741 RepID=A0A917ZWP8_9ACTN|nr:hypothetical protein [Wenjunlia tyrosinilytica]GGO95806.1 hypothetical protein GCM10012280_53820 [Wenjunlia tyrosinilytica]
MTLVPWDAKFEDVLRATLPMLDPTSRLEPSTRLLDYGLDEERLEQIADRLEETYCVVLPRESLSLADTATPGSVWEILQATVAALWADDLITLGAA